MNSPKVSVVVPTYNTEAYVEQAVRSIMDQTLREIEIIVINDGSTDGSLAVVERLAAHDSRIVVHSQPNKGLSQARNAGIDRAHGEFIYFMDSDDLLETDTLALCYDRCQASQLDFVFFDAESFGAPEAKSAWYDYRRAKHFRDEFYRGADLLGQMLDRRCYRASACLSFIRTSYLSGQGLRFHPGILHEDELFTPQLYIGAGRAAGIERSFFRRRLRAGSIMGSSFSQRNLDGYMTVIRELDHYALQGDRQAQHLVQRLTKGLLISVTDNAWQLPFKTRWQLAAKLLTRYAGRVSRLATLRMLLKSPIKKLYRR